MTIDSLRKAIATMVTVYCWFWVLTAKADIRFLAYLWIKNQSSGPTMEEIRHYSNLVSSVATFVAVVITGIVWLLALRPAQGRKPES